MGSHLQFGRGAGALDLPQRDSVSRLQLVVTLLQLGVGVAERVVRGREVFRGLGAAASEKEASTRRRIISLRFKPFG